MSIRALAPSPGPVGRSQQLIDVATLDRGTTAYHAAEKNGCDGARVSETNPICSCGLAARCKCGRGEAVTATPRADFLLAGCVAYVPYMGWGLLRSVRRDKCGRSVPPSALFATPSRYVCFGDAGHDSRCLLLAILGWCRRSRRGARLAFPQMRTSPSRTA